ncbi:MAG: hypothetical protein ACQEXJ_20730 [Myxococcota bacterium]
MALMALVGLLVAPHVRAEERPWHFDAEAVTDLPIQVGGQGTFELPGRLRLGVSVGVMPRGYIRMINEIGTGAGWYNEATADLVGSVLTNSLVIRPKVGWRPVPDRGLYFDGSYTLAALGGAVTGPELFALASGIDPPDGAENAEVRADAALHMLGLEVGWAWTVQPGLRLRAAVGGTFTLGSSTDVTYDGPGGGTANARTFERGVEGYLNDVFRSYVHTVVLSVGVGWRMF